MSTPKGMTCRNFTLVCRDQILLYHNAEHIIMQLRRQVPTDENVLSPSFKVAVDLSPFEAVALASELNHCSTTHTGNFKENGCR